MNFNEWFETFLDEKNLPFCEWEITDNNGEVNFINSGVVAESIFNAPDNEQSKIKDTIVMIYFKNGDINHFFKHLATALVMNK